MRFTLSFSRGVTMNSAFTRSGSSAIHIPPSGFAVILCVCGLFLAVQAIDRSTLSSPKIQFVIRSATAAQDIHTLEVGKPVERKIAGNESHSFQITLASGQYLRVIVEQRSDDLITTLNAPDDRRLGEYDCRWSGAESVSVIAGAAGSYRLTVRTLQKAANRGAYQVRIEELRESLPQDNARLVAEKASTEAKRLIDQGTEQPLRGAKEKLETALPLWQSIGDRSLNRSTTTLE